MAVFYKQGTWWIDWYEGGRRRRKKTHAHNKTEAKRVLQQVKARIAPRDVGVLDTKLRCTELVTRYLEAIAGTKSTHTRERALIALRNFFTWCPVRRVTQLSPELFERYAAHRKQEGAGVRTINIELANLKTCLNWGVKNRLIATNPMAWAQKLPGEYDKKLRFLSEDEMGRLLRAARGTVYGDIFYFFIRTGMRKNELIHLRWDDVDFKNGLIRIGGHKDEHGEHHTKTYKERHVPMDDGLATVIARQPRRPDSPYVFANERGKARKNNLLRELKRHANRAEIEGATLHVLRHTFASHLVMKGVDIATVKELMGHSSVDMTMRYAHLNRAHLRRAIETLRVPGFDDTAKVVAGPGFKRKAAK